MQENKQNKQIRSAIDDLQQIPGGFVFNSQRVWTDLEQQLPKAKKRNVTFYYAAAAVLLITGTVYLFFMKKDTKQLLHTPTTAFSDFSKKKTGPSVIHQQKNQQQHNLATSIQSVKKKAMVDINKPGNDQKEISSIEIKEPAFIPAPVEQTVVIVPAINEPQKQELKKSPVAVPGKPAPKKYKVIHIDELNSAVPVPDLQNNMSRYEFKKMIQQQNDEKEILLPADNNVKQILFFKLKPTTTTTTTTIVEN